MKHKTYFAYLVLATVMTGCLKVQKKDAVAAKATQSKAQTQSVTINRELRLNDIFVEFIGQRRPNVYDVLLSWPQTRDRVRVSLDGKVLFTKNTSEVFNHTLNNLAGGDKLNLLVEILKKDEDSVLSSEARDLEIPEDYVFPEQFVLDYDLKIHNNRVFMNKSVITTQSFNLEIIAKELIVLDESLVQGFPQGTKASPGYGGRSGGLINIEVEAAEGSLNFALNSEAGGDGLQGYYEIRTIGKDKTDVLTPRCARGGSGFSAGRNNHLRLKVNKAANFYSYRRPYYSEGGNPGPRLGQAPASYPAMADESNCPQNPTIGAAASSGLFCIMLPGLTPEQGCE